MYIHMYRTCMLRAKSSRNSLQNAMSNKAHMEHRKMPQWKRSLFIDWWEIFIRTRPLSDNNQMAAASVTAIEHHRRWIGNVLHVCATAVVNIWARFRSNQFQHPATYEQTHTRTMSYKLCFVYLDKVIRRSTFPRFKNFPMIIWLSVAKEHTANFFFEFHWCPFSCTWIGLHCALTSDNSLKQ